MSLRCCTVVSALTVALFAGSSGSLEESEETYQEDETGKKFNFKVVKTQISSVQPGSRLLSKIYHLTIICYKKSSLSKQDTTTRRLDCY